MATLAGWAAILLSVTLAAFRGVSSQMDSCPELGAAVSDPSTSCSFNNCTSLTCQFDQHESLTFVVDGCVDPAQVVVTVRNELHELDAQQIFNKSGVITLIGGRMLNVDMSRNATHMDFAVSISHPASAAIAPVPVVPQVFVSLTPDICMCENIRSFASKFVSHPSFPANCSANEGCDGVNCRLPVAGSVYSIETLILPCINSVDLIVRNQGGSVVYASIFNETTRRPATIMTLPVTFYVTIESRPYSMDVSATLEVFLFGNVEVFPLHTIILDRTHCNLPNFTTLPPPPPPTPLPPPDVDSSPICQSFYAAISELFTEPFVCGFLGNCNAGISCTLTLLNLRYTLTVGYVNAAENFVFRMFDQNGRGLGSGNMDVVSVDLPSPSNTNLVFLQRTVLSGVRRIQIDLSLPVDVGAIEVHTLLPLSQIALAEEQCQALIQANSDPDTTCVANGDCTGLLCDLDVSSDMVFVVDKCKDPVVVNVTTFHGGVSAVNSLIQNDRIFLGGGEYLAVTMSRNATDLNFMAFVTSSAQSNDQLRPVVPQVFVPLNASDCMCESMAQLAGRAGHTVVETNCEANSDCNGIRCLLSVLGAVFHVQVEVSACDEVLFIEVLADGVEDPLLLTEVNQSGRYVIEVVSGFPLNIDVTLEGRPYSMLIAATIDEPLFGLVEIVPRHLLILDRTSCNHRHFVTLPPLPPPTPPPGPGGSVSDTCKALYDVILDNFMEPFACRLLTSCDEGIQCTLEILDTRYDVVLSVSRDSKSVSMEVQFEGQQLLTRESGGAINVTLPRPMFSNLSLTQNFDPQSASVTMQLDLYVFALDGSPRRDVLISRTEIPIESASTSSSATIVVATVVPILLLIAVVVVVGVIILAVMVMRKKGKTQAFEFQPMSHSELEAKDLENYLGTAEGTLPGTRAGVITVSSKNGSGAGGGKGGGREDEKAILRDVDLQDQKLEKNSDKGHLV